MLATRRKAFAERLPLVKERSSRSTSRRSPSGAKRWPPRSRPAKRPATAWPSPTTKQLELLDALKEVRRIVDSPTADEEVFKARDRVRLVSGVLSWQLAQDSVGRLWDAKDELDRIQSELAEAQAPDADALSAAQRDEPTRFDRFGQRIAAIDAAAAA